MRQKCEDEDRDMIGLLIRNKCKVCEKYNCDECLSEKFMKCQADQDIVFTQDRS